MIISFGLATCYYFYYFHQCGNEEDENLEYILYDLKETRLDGLGNKKSYVRTNLGKYPIPERTVIRTFDEDNQPIIKTGSVSDVNTGYEFPFTVEKADELHRCVDKVTASKTKKTEYIVERLGEYKISVNSWKDFRNGDFETLYATGNAEGVEKPVVRTKPKIKSKEKEQSDFQKEILKKNYTTTNLIKQKEEDDRLKIQQETVTASTASQSRG